MIRVTFVEENVGEIEFSVSRELIGDALAWRAYSLKMLEELREMAPARTPEDGGRR